MAEAKKKIVTKRNGYYYPVVKQNFKNIILPRYCAVTEILGNSIDKPALGYWKGLQAARIALADPTLNEKAVMSEVGKISGKAASRGRTVHNLTEVSDIKGSKIDSTKLPKEYRGYIEAFNKFKEEVNPKLLYNEQVVLNNEHQYAGTLDRIYDMGGRVNLVDIKTSKDFYKDMGLQLSAYKHCKYMYYEKDGNIEAMPNIDGMYILLLGEDGNYAIRQMPDSFSVFLAAFSIYKFLHADKLEDKNDTKTS
jgi:hypothetical protein